MGIKKINKEKLIKQISDKTFISYNIVRNVYEALEASVHESMLYANKDNDVIIRLFEGLNIDCVYQPKKTKLNNLTGKVIDVPSRIKLKANFTRNFCDKLCDK